MAGILYHFCITQFLFILIFYPLCLDGVLCFVAFLRRQLNFVFYWMITINYRTYMHIESNGSFYFQIYWLFPDSPLSAVLNTKSYVLRPSGSRPYVDCLIFRARPDWHTFPNVNRRGMFFSDMFLNFLLPRTLSREQPFR